MNYQARIFTPLGVRVLIVLCLEHLAARRPDLVNRNTRLTTERCEDCVRNGQLTTVDAALPAFAREARERTRVALASQRRRS